MLLTQAGPTCGPASVREQIETDGSNHRVPCRSNRALFSLIFRAQSLCCFLVLNEVGRTICQIVKEQKSNNFRCSRVVMLAEVAVLSTAGGIFFRGAGRDRQLATGNRPQRLSRSPQSPGYSRPFPENRYKLKFRIGKANDWSRSAPTDI